MTRPAPDPVGLNQESVWDFPRPSKAQPVSAHLVVILGGRTIAETRNGIRTIETSHPPTYYFPPEDIAPGVLRPSTGSSFCEWKGTARYFDVVAGGIVRLGAAWSYPRPTASFAALIDHVAFYAEPMDGCFVDGERVEPQHGGFYGGWITSRQAGPFKGVAGSRGW